MNYYNEIDPFAADWLRGLMLDDLIPYGHVDERSILDVTPDDLRGYTQHHFFAGIGVWAYALRLAGWPDDRRVWTGSCPCQPFSQAGKGNGFADERHLWPYWHHLIRVLKPDVVFGEQVASPDGLAWFDLVQADLEAEDYVCGAVDICAAGVGAPHLRQRLWLVADANGQRLAQRGEPHSYAQAGEQASRRDDAGRRSANDGMGDSDDARLEGRGLSGSERPGQRTAWSPSDFVWCRDGKWRPVEPGTFPLAHRAPSRVGRLRAYGNAIVPQAAAEFVKAYMDCCAMSATTEAQNGVSKHVDDSTGSLTA